MDHFRRLTGDESPDTAFGVYSSVPANCAISHDLPLGRTTRSLQGLVLRALAGVRYTTCSIEDCRMMAFVLEKEQMAAAATAPGAILAVLLSVAHQWTFSHPKTYCRLCFGCRNCQV
jgi:hypothetical protein